jgi:hypothetical protein
MAKDKQKKEENEAVLRKMMDLEATIKHLKACGVEPVLPLDCLKLAEEAYREGHFDNATCHIDSGLRSAKGFFKAYAMAFSKKIFYDIHKAKQYGDNFSYILADEGVGEAAGLGTAGGLGFGAPMGAIQGRSAALQARSD